MTAELGFLLGAAAERYIRTLFVRLGAIGYGHLTPTQAVTVIMIGDGVATVSALADRQGMTVPAVSKVCRALEADGLLGRTPDASDARSQRLALTDKGAEVLAASAAGSADAEREWAERAGADAVGTVHAALAAYTRDDAPPPAPTIRIRFG